jgi:hypothetical protein
MVERWRKGTPEEFWQEFSHDNGSKMTFTAISQHLRQQRILEDKATAEQVKAEYGLRFSEHFNYHYKNRVMEMTDAASIAKRYRALCSTRN